MKNENDIKGKKIKRVFSIFLNTIFYNIKYFIKWVMIQM
jgi:hypothetical protein